MPIVSQPPPGRADAPHPVLKYSGFKTWGAFEREAQLWELKQGDGGYILHRWRRARGGGYETDRPRYEHLPEGTTLEAACRRLIEGMEADTVAR